MSGPYLRHSVLLALAKGSGNVGAMEEAARWLGEGGQETVEDEGELEDGEAMDARESWESEEYKKTRTRIINSTGIFYED